jgi:hypothetical protein
MYDRWNLNAMQIVSYMGSNMLAANPDKTQFVIFGGGEQRCISIGTSVIVPSSSVTLLGLGRSR